uniref:Ubiquitin carboxyl-terminal hydrolase 7 n=1 Tax=Panagrellus redivivus TaxID=6233 RepID=A0A7E4UQQ8_PANRE
MPSLSPSPEPQANHGDNVKCDLVRSPATTDVTRCKVSKRRESPNDRLEPSPKRFNVSDADAEVVEPDIVQREPLIYRPADYLPHDDIRRFKRLRSDSMENDYESSDSESVKSPLRLGNDDFSDSSDSDSIPAPDPSLSRVCGNEFTGEVLPIVPIVPKNGSNMIVQTFTPNAHQKLQEYVEDWNYNVAAGEIRYTLKGVNAFRQAQEGTSFYSRYFYIRGVPFRIMLLPRDINNGVKDINEKTGFYRHRGIGFFVQCNPVRPTKWTFRGSVQLTMISHMEDEPDHSRNIVHCFHPGENDWGFAQFYNCDLFDEPDNPFLRDDMLDFHVVIHIDPPKLNTWMLPPVNYKLAGHTGIRNLGSTCYFNSLLQMLFGINKLRKIIYEYDSSGDTDNDTLMFELQTMFFLMQYADYPVDTINLGKLLWTDTISQEDVHDMFMKLIDRICTAVKDKDPNEEISDLFQSMTRRSIRCTNIDFQKILSEEKMNCILLSVRVGDRAYENVADSLTDYVSISRLDGDNCYDTGDHGLQAAEMSTKFSKFAPIVVLTIQRSAYENFQVKLNDLFGYEEKMDLIPFIDDVPEFGQENGNYSLYSVVVHYGESGCGHYVCYINTNLKGKHRWIKCDDESIYRCADFEAINNNFGVPDNSKDTDIGTAYVLTYVRNNMIDELMCDVDQNTLHPNIRSRVNERFVQHHLAYQVRTETTYQHSLLLVTEKLLQSSVYQRFDLLDVRNPKEHFPRVFLPKDIFVCDIYQEIRKQVAFLAEQDFRIYLFRYAEISNPLNRNFKGGLRPGLLVPPEGVLNCSLFSENTVHFAIYVHLVKCAPMITEFITPVPDHLVFVKLYHDNRIIIVGTIFVSPMQVLFDKMEEIRRICRLPSHIKIRLYTEVCPYDVREIEEDFVVDPHNGFDGDGSIIVVEIINNTNPNSKQFPHFWKNLSRGVTLKLEMDVDLYQANCIRHANRTYNICCFIDTPLKEIAERLAYSQYNGVVPRENILIWRSGGLFDKPFLTFYDLMNNSTVGDLLGMSLNTFDARERYEFTLKFVLLTFPILKDCAYTQAPAYLLTPDYRLMVNSHRVVFSPKWTLGEMCGYLAPNYPFTENGTKKLRVVLTFRAAGEKAIAALQCRVYKIMDDNMTCEALNKLCYDRNYAIRIEEVPIGQLPAEDEEARKKEHFIPVVNYELTIMMLYETSFFVKIIDGEPFSAVRERIRGLMKLKEDENFDDFKFYVYAGINPRIVLTDQDRVDLSIWANERLSYQEQPYIAIKRPILDDVHTLKFFQ